jgi:cold shock CspA family protein
VRFKEGAVVVLVQAKGFGFIAHELPSGELEEVFFHARVVHGGRKFEDLVLGLRVSFSFGRSRDGKGPRASRVVPGVAESSLYERWAARKAGQEVA